MSLAHFSPTGRVGYTSRLRLESGEEANVPRLMVYPNYFATLGIHMVAGRDFGNGDLGEGAPLVAVVNQAFARRFFGGASPVGRRYFTGAVIGRGLIARAVEHGQQHWTHGST